MISICIKAAPLPLPPPKNRWLNEPEWAEGVTVVSSDMREWQRHSDCPVKADILISELLGSWGDNELSPECLDGAQLYLKEVRPCLLQSRDSASL